MNLPSPVQEDLQQLLATLDSRYVRLELLCNKVNEILPEVQYQDKEGSLRLYTSLCTNLSVQLAQYMRLRRLVLLPYLKELQDKEEDGHDCRACGGGCRIQHTSHNEAIREAHVALRELLEHLQPVGLSLHERQHHFSEVFRSLREDMMQMEQTLNEVLFIEDSALLPMVAGLQRNIGAHE